MTQPLISTLFLSHFDELVLERGGDVTELLSMSGLPLTVLSENQALIPFPLQNKLLGLAAQRLNWPTFGLELAARQQIGFLGPLYPLIGKEADVESAIKIFNQHLSVQVQAVDTRLERQGESANFIVEGSMLSIASSPCFQDHGIALANNFLKWLCGPNWRPRAVYFPREAPKDTGAYSNYFKAPVAFGHERLTVSFDAAYLNKAIDPSTVNISTQLRHLLEAKAVYRVSDQVKFMIQSLLSSGQCDTQCVAEALGHTRRTLQRRLEEEGTSFQALLDSTRASIARSYLVNSYYRMSDIALMLGFSEQSSFTRSFQRWFNVTPREWKRMNAQEKSNTSAVYDRL